MKYFADAARYITPLLKRFDSVTESSMNVQDTFNRFRNAVVTSKPKNLIKNYIFEYNVFKNISGITVTVKKQKEIKAKNFQGAIRKLYLEAEPGFGGLTRIIKEEV